MRLPPVRSVEWRNGTSPIVTSISDLEMIEPRWRIEIGVPDDSPLWIRGVDFTRAHEGPFHSLLSRIAQRLKTSDLRTVAASFALRFGWTSFSAIAPFLLHRCVPNVSLDNISVKFREDTFFERIAIHEVQGTILREGLQEDVAGTKYVADETALLRALRSTLYAQAEPVVQAMYEWSGFSKKGAWGQITSSWASQFINACDRFGGQKQALPIVEEFFAGDDIITASQPRLHPVTLANVTHLYQRRASCCRYYLLPQGSLCASCPLVSQEERLKLNLEWMRKQLEPKIGSSSKHG